MIDLLRIAKICHEANKAYCESIGDLSQKNWSEAPHWQQISALKGVELHLSGDHPPSKSHESWLEEKERDGWKWGPEKDPATKKHPCMMAYDELPQEQKIKDFLFKNIVDAFKQASK